MSQQILELVEKPALKAEVPAFRHRRYGRRAHEDSGRRQRAHPDFHGRRDRPQRLGQPRDVHGAADRGE